jgi:hypothetical protein
MKIIHSIGPKNGQITGQQVSAELESEVELGNLDAPPAPTNLSANYTGPNYEPPKESTTSTLTWNSSDLDQGLDNGIVHEKTANTAYDNASVIRKGDSTSDPLFNDSLVAWYPLQESSGSTAYDFSGNNYDGSVSGATQAGDVPPPNKRYVFDGSDDYIDQGSTLDSFGGDMDTNFSVAFWMKSSSIGSESVVTGVSNNNENTYLVIGSGFNSNTGELEFTVRDESQNEISVSTDNTYDDGTWHHVVMNKVGNSASDLEIYVDGSQASTSVLSSGTLSDPSDFNVNNFVGAWNAAGTDNRNFPGDLADFRIFNDSLSSSEINTLYNDFLADVNGDSLVTWYEFQEDGGGTVDDRSTNNYDGTVNGATFEGIFDLAGLPTYGFDGQDDYVDTGEKFSGLNDGDFTFAFWIYPTDSSSRSFLFDTGSGSSSNDGVAIELYNPSRGDDLEFLPRYSSNEDVGISDLPVNEWTHVVVVSDHSGNTHGEYRSYKNAVLEDSRGTVSNPSTSEQTLQIGQIDGSYELNFPGYLSDFRIYNRGLSESELGGIYGVFGSNSSHEAVYKGSSVDSSPSINFTSVNIPAGSNATLRVLEDNDSDSDFENTDIIDLNDSDVDYSASGLSGSGNLSLNVSLSNSDLTVGSSVEVPVNVTGEN